MPGLRPALRPRRHLTERGPLDRISHPCLDGKRGPHPERGGSRRTERPGNRFCCIQGLNKFSPEFCLSEERPRPAWCCFRFPRCRREQLRRYRAFCCFPSGRLSRRGRWSGCPGAAQTGIHCEYRESEAYRSCRYRTGNPEYLPYSHGALQPPEPGKSCPY